MKKVLITLVLSLCMSQISFSQFGDFGFNQDKFYDCPPRVWCHPDGENLGGGPWEYGYEKLDILTSSANYGKNLSYKLKKSGSADDIWKVLINWIECGYNSDTAQASLCNNDEAQNFSQNVPKKYKMLVKKLSNKSFIINPNFYPAYFDGDNYKKSLMKSLDKMKRNQIIKKWKQGYTLSMGFKYYTNKNKSEYATVLYLKNNKNIIIATPMLLTKEGKTYIVDIIFNSK